MSENDLPVIRANSETLDLLYELYASRQTLKRFAEKQEQRLRVIPNGWRDIKLAHSLVNKLIKNLNLTMQPEKRDPLERMGHRMKFKTWTGTEAINTSPQEVVLTQKEFDSLLHYARKECAMCIEQRCKSCRLGKTLDIVLKHDRNGESWANIPLECD